MYAIFKCSFMFRLPNADKDLSGEKAVPGVTRNLRIDASPNPQQVPDWIGKTRLFRAACDKGRILEIKGVNAKALIINPEPETETDGGALGLVPPADPPAVQGGRKKKTKASD
jgi:hypothetical protein